MTILEGSIYELREYLQKGEGIDSVERYNASRQLYFMKSLRTAMEERISHLRSKGEGNA